MHDIHLGHVLRTGADGSLAPDPASPVGLRLDKMCRHFLITGRTGSGKTRTIQRIIEGLSAAGVPVFAADVKGDLSGIATGCPTTFLDVYADPLSPHAMRGVPCRATIHEFGPELLARVLGVNENQAGLLHILFKESVKPSNIALALEMITLNHLDDKIGIAVNDYREEIGQSSGNVAPASAAVIRKRILQLIGYEARAGEAPLSFFGEPALDINDLMRVDAAGRGVVSLLDATRLYMNGGLYAAVLLYIMRWLWQNLPEVGDVKIPKFVMVFDESHLIFDGKGKEFQELSRTLEKMIRLIRSKGVGVIFASQHPRDIPSNILGQLNSRIQHGLHSVTPQDAGAVKAAVRGMRPNPSFNSVDVVGLLGAGQALVSAVDAAGIPQVTEIVQVERPVTRDTPLAEDEFLDHLWADPMMLKYGRGFATDGEMEREFRRRTGRSWPGLVDDDDDGLDEIRGHVEAALAAEIAAELEMA